MAKKYTLLPITLKQGFANSGIKQRVPYQLPAADDDLNWLEGFTDAYQRPVIAENLGEKGGRYVRMGQINQILENVSQAILNVKQSLDNVSETIDKGIKVEIDKVVTNANNALTNRKVVWLQTLGNQNCAGLKNFGDININNFKTKTNAVANLEWCNGLPLVKFTTEDTISSSGVRKTVTKKNVAIMSYLPHNYGGKFPVSFILDSKSFGSSDAYDEWGAAWDYSCNRFFCFLAHGEVYTFVFRDQYRAMAFIGI